ncbi:MAG: large conductance mechanosensitive channel protein MscL [Micrococcales bacterium]|nr:MAG: large conductance mechanosensitive channel protein MscL [Micrococcales bacterium]
MKQLWNEFKSFAMGGNMMDLALGFIIGAAFAALVESLAGNVLMQLVAVLVGKPDFSALTLTINGGAIKYGAFITDLVNFLLLAAVMFGIVQLLKRAGMGNFKAQGQRECPYCKEYIAIDAIRCNHCISDVDPVLLDEADIPLLQKRPGWVHPDHRSADDASGRVSSAEDESRRIDLRRRATAEAETDPDSGPGQPYH